MQDYDDDLALPDVDDDARPGPSTGKASARQQDGIIPAGWKPTSAKPVPVVRCKGTTRTGPNAGQRCGKWSIAGAEFCMKHGGQLPNIKEHAAAVVDAARMRLVGMADDAIDALEDLVQTGNADGIRLAAAKEILDRSGVIKGAEISVVVDERQSAADIVAEKLSAIAKRIAADEPKPEPEDLGEIVEEPDAD